MRTRFFSPYMLPVWLFVLAILLGSALLGLPCCLAEPAGHFSWLDSLFTATSALCVTGLAVRDTGTFFSPLGQGVLLTLIQLGGLGIMTYTSLAIYLLRQKISLSDRLAVGQILLRTPNFSLQRYIMAVVLGTLGLEFVGAIILFCMDSHGFAPWSALFHSVSAFCNAGFSLFPDSLCAYRSHWGVNFTFMFLIICGGLGFTVLGELSGLFRDCFRKSPLRLMRGSQLLSLHSRVVLSTSVILIVFGAIAIFLAELEGGGNKSSWDVLFLSSLFQSVTCRTAGFNTMDISHLTNLSLTMMLTLMFIGGSPGSTAGGIKTTTARALFGYLLAQIKGHSQVRIAHCALSSSTKSTAIALVVLAALTIIVASAGLDITEGGDIPHHLARGQFLETMFEAVSAFGTVGLSMGKTMGLTAFGKSIIIILMFIGRIGPVWILTALHSWQTKPLYRLPENDLPMG